MSCPNVNLESWKLLVSARGEDMAYYLWEKYEGEVPESESKQEIVKASIKATDILQSDKAAAVFSVLAKNKVTGEPFWKKLQTDLAIPKEQMELLKSFNTEDRNELVTNMLASYSYAVEINIAKEQGLKNQKKGFDLTQVPDTGRWVVSNFQTGTPKYFATKEEAEKYIKGEVEETPTQYYSNLTVPGGTNYTENEIATPAITPSIKGHAQFATDQGIGWFRSDEQTEGGELIEYDDDKNQRTIQESRGGTATKTRRILEVQSDLFQKGRDKKVLDQTLEKALYSNDVYNSLMSLPINDLKKYLSINDFNRMVELKNIAEKGEFTPEQEGAFEEEYNNIMSKVVAKFTQTDSKNAFLQLLNKDNNWVTFFVKSIIQDSVKKGYDKVLFPAGDTAAKVEGHESVKDFIKDKQKRLDRLEGLSKPEFFVVRVDGMDVSEEFETRKEAEKELKKMKLDDGGIFQTYEIAELDKFGDPLEDHSVEIAQLKTEIEDAEAGELKLSSISGFYENMVQNVLNKQYSKENVKRISDEYDNEWFEISLNKDRDTQRILFQMDEVPGSTASPETLEKVKQLAKKVGISIQDLADYAKKTGLDTKNINGVADLVRGVVAIATGREGQALTEEVIHLTTAILEQTNPQLVTSMLAKIDRFKIYKTVLEKYKTNKNYQLSNGKPDIRKIKKEAVDKLLVEVLINQNENETEFPELMQEENVSMIQKWWRAILDFIKGMYTSSNIDIFEESAKVILSDANIGTVSDIEGGETFYQIKNDAVDNYYDQVMAMHNRLKLVPEVTDAAGNVIEKRHYTRDNEKVAKTVTEKISEESKMPDRTEADKLIDNMKADWGDAGHDYIENYIITNLIDENGYARPKDLENKISTKLSPEIQKQIKAFAKELIASYKPGTRFVIEKRMVNEKVKGMLASTIDFMAIEPDDKTGIKIDTLDWKFTSINKNRTDDIPWYKQGSWKEQMGEYTKMHYSYGIKPNQIRKARMVPFILNYKYNIPGSPKSGLYIQSMEVGKLDSTTETKLYLLPVPVTTESTGVGEVDTLLASLRQQYDKMYKLFADPEKKYIKNIQLNQLSKAIRTLHLQLDFKPLAAVAKQFLENADKAFKTFDGIDYSKLSKDEIEDKLGELLEFKNSAEKYATIDETYLAAFPKEGLDEEGKKILTSLERVSNAVGRMMNKIQELQNNYVVQLAVKEGITTEETKDKVLNAEKEVTAIGKTFLESSKLASRIINLASNLVQNAKSLANIKIAKTAEQYAPLLLNLEKEASAKGKSAFDMIGTANDKGLSLIKKIDSKFWESYRLAKENEDKKFFLENMDVEEYNKLAKDLIEKGIEELNKTVFSTDPEGDFEEREYKIMKLKDSLDINSKTFNGYDGFDFDRLFKQTMKEDKHLSQEYREMAKSPAALKMWTYMVGLNDRARKMGYLTDRPNSFFPLIEASMINKLLQTKDLIGESKDFFKDLYTVKVNEEQNYSKLDPETHQLKKEIPRLFLRTDKEVNQLSKDLNKVLSLWTKALIEYDTNSKLENTLLTLHHVEKAKGHIIVDEKNEIVYEGGAPKIDLKTNKTADVLQTIIDDALYGLREDPTSLGNATLDLTIGKFKKDEDEKEKTKLSIKKGLENTNKLTQALAVGLKALVAIPNYFGVNMHAFIQSGSHYNYGEFQKNNAKVTTGVGLSTIDKALLHEILPLNEDISKEKMREIAKKQGLAKWLGTWTFQDVMMITNSFPEKLLQFANAKSFNDNAMVVNGKIVNIRQYLKAQDREKYKKDASGKYIMSEQERRNLENTFEERVAKLKETKSLPKIAKIEDDHLVIPGVTDEEIARYRNTIIEYARELNGQMSENNKAGYRRDSLFKSFMMFKNWIPKMIISRTVDIKKNVQLDQWQYGRTRAFVKTWAKLGLWNIGKMRAIIQGTDEGLAILDEMFQAKKEEHLRKTGEELEITQEEFYDMMRQTLSNQAKELGTLMALMTLVLSASASQPPEDATELEKNRYKFWMKATNKISDELAFYYNPLSFESITKGSVLPSLGLMTKAEKVIVHLSKEAYGQYMGDEDIMKNAHPTKYFLNLIPVASQFQNEILPVVYPEVAKDRGIRVTAESRQR